LRRANYVLIQRVSDLQRQVSLVPF
jgi:hypothetical protein